MMCEMNVHINFTEESTNNKEYTHATEITIQNCHNNHLVFAVCIHILQESKTSSFTYGYAQDQESIFRALPVFSDGHYEMDTNEEAFWEPASAEDELKKQLQDIIMSEDDLR